MTTKSSLRSLQTNSMSTNGNEIKSSRIYVKRPLSTTNFLPGNSATNGFSNQLKKRTLQLNQLFNLKIKPFRSNEQTNGHQTSPPLVFHAITPSSPDDVNTPTKQIDTEQRPQSPATRRIANVLAHTKIKALSVDQDIRSSGSEDDGDPLKSHSIDTDADESDNGNSNRLLKFRRFQKTRKSSNTSLPQKFENINERPHSSSNDDENNERRSKPASIKKSERKVTMTTTDEDMHIHQYHPLDTLQEKIPTTNNESSPSTPTVIVSNSQPSAKKVNRFQVKSIRKSQQQELLLVNATAAKSSNEDDCSVPNGPPSKLSTIDQPHTNTPTTDNEHPTTHTDGVENGHPRVRFHVTVQERKESIHEGEKVPHHATATVTLPITLAAPSSSASIAEEDDEEEAVAKSPDGRFIKYAKEIGRGAFKTVYRGLDTEASVPVAWCELQEFAQFDKHERARFKEEAEMLKKLQHPNIVQFYDFWEETNPRTNKKVIILVTELMTSGSLKGYIRKFKGQTEEKRINVMKKWCRQILKGLAYLHSRHPSVIHRDLKCDNVFISGTTGRVKIGDLGLATFKTQTFARSMRGTMEFMAPEMFDEKYDELVDIYSFGLCMLEIITGEYPYIECKGPTAVIKRVIAGLKPDCYYKVENDDVREIIDCCIRTHKEERLPVNELLQHSFFLEDNGLRIDFVRDPSNNSQVLVSDNSIDLKLKIIDKCKRKALWTEHEAIRFRFNFTTDKPEQIVDELIQKKYIFDEDKNFVVQSIKDRLRAYQYEQIDRKAGVFCRDEKRTINPSPHVAQHHQPQQQVVQPAQSLPPPQQPTTPLLIQAQVASVPSPVVAPQQPIAKSAIGIPPAKSAVQTDPIPITQLSELSSSVSGSAGSLEILDAALKKTFNKNNAPHSTNTVVTITSENSETSVSLVSQDESSSSKLTIETAIIDQQQKEESTGTTVDELATNLFPPSTSTALQTQSQPTTMLSNHQTQLLQHPVLLPQTSQSFSCSTVTPPSLNLISTSETIKPLLSSSSSSSNVPEPIENTHTSTSPVPPNETNQSTIPSDTAPQAPISGSLKQLDALLKSTFKNPTKPNGTACNSDSETPNPNISLTITDENSSKTHEIEPDELKRKCLDLFITSNPSASTSVQSQPNISSMIVPKPTQPVKSHSSSHFDPFISPERIYPQELNTSVKTPLSNDDTITASSSSNDLSELKTMMMDLSKTLLNRMAMIEHKIDEHRIQTTQINNLLTQTILPSLVDLADIIQQTPNIDSRVRTKLENIQTNIRASQQQTEIKDLMEI